MPSAVQNVKSQASNKGADGGEDEDEDGLEFYDPEQVKREQKALLEQEKREKKGPKTMFINGQMVTINSDAANPALSSHTTNQC